MRILVLGGASHGGGASLVCDVIYLTKNQSLAGILDSATTEYKGIKDYWDDRAKRKDPSATTDDLCLRELEFRTLVKTLKQLRLPDGANILDVGCGDGFTTARLAKKFPQYNFTGFDFSPKMIENARKHDNVTFIVANVLDMYDFGRFDVTITDRCLINILELCEQVRAIYQIAHHTKTYYIAIENFLQGHNNMNTARAKVGLNIVEIRWHNNYFDSNVFSQIVRKHFDIIHVNKFSSTYYFVTRVLYAKVCDVLKVTPTHNTLLHKLSIKLLSVGNLSPIAMYVMKKKE